MGRWWFYPCSLQHQPLFGNCSSFLHHCMCLFLHLVDCLFCIILWIKQLQSQQSYSWKTVSRCELLSAKVLARTFKRKFQWVTEFLYFRLQLTAAFKDCQTVEHISWIPTKVFSGTPFLLLLCYLAVHIALTKYYYHVLSHSSLLDWLDWWKRVWEKYTVWMRSHDGPKKKLQQRENTLTPSSSHKVTISAF